MDLLPGDTSQSDHLSIGGFNPKAWLQLLARARMNTEDSRAAGHGILCREYSLVPLETPYSPSSLLGGSCYFVVLFFILYSLCSLRWSSWFCKTTGWLEVVSGCRLACLCFSLFLL